MVSLALFLIFPSSAAAQGEITLDSLKVRLWSEYDQPSMLVIYDFQVTSDTQLPANVDIRIPNSANIIAIAFDENGKLVNADFTGPVADGNWQVLTFKVLAHTTYHLEYYQPLERDGNVRSFTYKWSGEHPVNNFSVEVDVPSDSTGIKTTPTIPFVQDQNIMTGGAVKNGLGAGDTYQVQLSYSRSSETTIATPPSAGVESSAPIESNTEGRVSMNNLPYILGGFGAILILGALFYAWRANQSQSSKPRKRRRAKQEANSQIYCHECGTRAQPSDRFCRTCGSKLRTE